MTHPHVAVIGAGIVGATIAFRLASAGAQVTVIDRGMPGAAATSRSFGWINASFHASPAHFRLRLASLEAWRRLDAEVPDLGLRWTGAISWEFGGTAFDAQVGELASLGYPLRVLDSAGFASLEPQVPAPSARSVLFPGEGAVDAAHAAGRLLDAAADFGAQLWLGSRVTAIATTGGRASGIVTAEGVLAADHVVLAGGDGAPELLAPLGFTLPMLKRPGLILRTRPLPPVIRHILVCPSLELRQDAQGRILAPTAAAHQGDASDSVADLPGTLADEALARLRTILPVEGLGWDRVTLADRPVPGDGLPAIGPIPGTAGLTLAVMHSGVTLAAAAGGLVADEVLAGAASPLLEDFRPARFRKAP